MEPPGIPAMHTHQALLCSSVRPTGHLCSSGGAGALHVDEFVFLIVPGRGQGGLVEHRLASCSLREGFLLGILGNGPEGIEGVNVGKGQWSRTATKMNSCRYSCPCGGRAVTQLLALGSSPALQRTPTGSWGLCSAQFQVS